MDAKHMNLVLEMYNDGRHMPNNEVTLRGEGLYRKHSVSNYPFIHLFIHPLVHCLHSSIHLSTY